MIKRIFVLFMGISLLLGIFGFASAADYRFQNSTGSDLVVIHGDNGNLTVTGNVSGDWFIGNVNASSVQNNNWIEDGQEGNLNVNSSDYWDGLNSFNASELEQQSDGNLGILDSFINLLIDNRITQSFIKALGFYNTTEVDSAISDANTSVVNWADGKFITQANEGNLNVNSSNFWDGLGSPSDIFGSLINNNLGWLNWSQVDNGTFVHSSGEGGLNVNSSDYWDGYDTPADIKSGDSDLLDGYDSLFFMPLNKSVYGNFDFNSGWASGGVSIIDGDIYAQTGYFYNISGLQVSTLEVNGSLIPQITDSFDIGSSSERWKDLYLSGEVFSEGVGNNYFMGNVGIGTINPQNTLNVEGDGNFTTGLYVNNKNLENAYDYATNGTYYLASNPFGFYNSTTLSAAETDPHWTANYTLYNSTWSSTFNSTYNTWAYNQTTPAINKILSFGFYNISDFDIADYYTKTQIDGFNYYNASDFSIGDYFTKTEVLNFGYYNLTDFDINDYYLNSNPFGFINVTTAFNLNNRILVDWANVTNKVPSDFNNQILSMWENITNAPTDLSFFNNDLGIGNWTADKPNYYNTTQTDYQIGLANTSMANYVNAQDILFNNSIAAYVNSQDVYYNTSLANYVNSQDILYNNSMKSYVDALNVSQGNWVIDNYVPYTGATKNVNLGANNFTVDTNVLYVDSTGNRVGIGTSSPLYNMHVNGPSGAPYSLYLGANNADGYMTLGANNPGQFSIVSGRNSAGNFQTTHGTSIAGFGGDLRFSALSGATAGTSFSVTRRMTIKGDTGNVGIGTESPANVLDLGSVALGRSLTWSGTRNIGTSYSSGRLAILEHLKLDSTADNVLLASNNLDRSGIILEGGSSDGAIKFVTRANDGSTNDVFDINANTKLYVGLSNVGIGTTTPTLGKLQINQVLNTNTGGLTIVDNASSRSMRLFVDGANAVINGNSGGTIPLVLNTGGGNVGIGTTNPQNKLNVVGDGNFTGNLYSNGVQVLTSYTETDPLWTANYTLYNSTWSSTFNSTYNTWAYNQTTPAVNKILSFDYYNLTDFDINDYYLASNPFGYYNSTDFSIGNYVPYTGATANVVLGDNNLSVGGTDFFVNNNEGRVGIGITTPDQPLEIENAGNAYIHLDGGNAAVLFDRVNVNARSESRYQTDGISSWLTGLVDADLTGLDGSQFFIGQTSGGVSPAFVIDTSNRVGIGTSSPLRKTEIYGTGNTSSLYLHGGSTTTGDYSELTFGVSTGELYHAAIRSPRQAASANGVLTFLTQNTGGAAYSTLTERMRIDKDGNVGIGTDSPSEKLEVNGNIELSDVGYLKVDGTNVSFLSDFAGGYFKPVGTATFNGDTSTAYGSLLLDKGYGVGWSKGASGKGLIQYFDSSDTFHIATGTGGVGSTTDKFVIDSDGNVGIGTSSPDVKLDTTLAGTAQSITTALQLHTTAVNGVSELGTGTAIDFRHHTTADVERIVARIVAINEGSFAGSSNNDAGLAFYTVDGSVSTTAAERLRISNNGNVGIGTTNPQNKLNVIGDGNFTTGLYVNNKNLENAYDYATNGTYYLASNPFGFYNSTTLSAAETDPLWTANYTLYNSTWSSTFNSTYNTWAYNQTTPAINKILSFDYYNSTTLTSNSQLDNGNNYWNDTYATFNKTYADTLYYGIGNPSGFIDWSQATNGTLALSSALSNYYPLNNPFGFYNISDFDIADYYTKTQIDGFNYYNASDFSIGDYFTKTEVLNFDYYNLTDFDINDYYLNSNPFGYYNSTTIGGVVNTSYYVPYTGATKNVNLGANNFTVDTNVLYVDSTGNRVGIGTSSPSYTTHINGPSGAPYSLYLGANNADGYMTLGANNPGQFSIVSGRNSAGNFQTTHGTSIAGFGGDLRFSALSGATAGTSFSVTRRMTIKGNTGNVGIGTESPNSNLEIGGNLAVGTSTAAPETGLLVKGDVSMTNGIFNVNGTLSGVGIGTTNPQNKLNVIGDGNFTGNLIGGGTVTFSGLTANRLVATDASKNLVSAITADNLRNSVTGTTGTGNLVFSVTPTFTGTLNAAAITATGNIRSDGDIFTSGTGDDLWLGSATQSSANFRAYATGEVHIDADSIPITFGEGQDADIYYDGTDLIINSAVVGGGATVFSGGLTRVGSGNTPDFASGNGNLFVENNAEVGKDLQVDGTSFIGYERTNLVSSVHVNWFSCPDGKYVLGGGVDCSVAGVVTVSYPLNETTWYGECDTGAPAFSLICARVGD